MPGRTRTRGGHGRRTAELRRRLLVSRRARRPRRAARHGSRAAVPRLAVGSLAAATPVATWGAWPFHRAAAVNARHGAATMDTLVSVGVAAAYLWSLYALFAPADGKDVLLLAGGAGARHLPGGRRRRHRAHPARPVPGGAGEAEAGAALRALLDLGAKQATVLRDGREISVPADRARASATSSWSGRGRRSPPTASSSRALRGGHVDADRRAGAGRGRRRATR